MTKRHLKTQMDVLSAILEEKGLGRKLSYCLGKNIGIIEDELRALARVIEPKEEYKKFLDDYTNLCKEYSRKDDKGNAISRTLQNGATEFDIEEERKDDFEDSVRKLKEKNNETLKDQEEREKILDDEVDPETFYKVKMKYIPKDHPALTPKIMYWLRDIIIDEEIDEENT